jgi:hypothetical protein
MLISKGFHRLRWFFGLVRIRQNLLPGQKQVKSSKQKGYNLVRLGKGKIVGSG